MLSIQGEKHEISQEEHMPLWTRVCVRPELHLPRLRLQQKRLGDHHQHSVTVDA